MGSEFECLDLQIAITGFNLPSFEQMQQWISAVLQQENTKGIVCVRVVDYAEIEVLNTEYRNKAKPTNVLAFPSELPPELEPDFLGDILLCAPVIAQEAQDQAKNVEDHYAHLLIHGTLHLLGYDHQIADEAKIMEALEIKILSQFNIKDPY